MRPGALGCRGSIDGVCVLGGLRRGRGHGRTASFRAGDGAGGSLSHREILDGPGCAGSGHPEWASACRGQAPWRPAHRRRCRKGALFARRRLGSGASPGGNLVPLRGQWPGIQGLRRAYQCREGLSRAEEAAKSGRHGPLAPSGPRGRTARQREGRACSPAPTWPPRYGLRQAPGAWGWPLLPRSRHPATTCRCSRNGAPPGRPR